MILGRPTNLWLAAGSGILNLGFLIGSTLGYAAPETLVAGANLALAAVIALVAGQPPALSPGDAYTIVTPKGQPNYEATVATPPKSTTPEPAT